MIPGLGHVFRFIDGRMRRRQGIYEFSQDPRCLFRLSVGHTNGAQTLRDGTEIRAGDPVLELHFWSAHFPPFPKDGIDLTWGRTIEHNFHVTFVAMLQHLDSQPHLRQIKALRGETAFATRAAPAKVSRLLGRFGFEPLPEKRGWLHRTHDRLADLLVWGLAAAFNPRSLKGWDFTRRRVWYFLSRAELQRRYGDGAPVRTAMTQQ